MPVPLTDFIDTTSPLDVFPTHLAKLGKGGHRTVDSTLELTSIPMERREEGMLVYVSSNKITYQLQPDLTTWLPFSGSGGSISTWVVNEW